MANPHVLEHTSMIRRVLEAVLNLVDNLDMCLAFWDRHGLDVTDPANLPAGFTQADYDEVEAIRAVWSDWVTANADLIARFTAFEEAGVPDTLEHLSKKTWKRKAPKR